MSTVVPSRSTASLVPVAAAPAPLTALKFLWIFTNEGWELLVVLTLPLAVLALRAARGGRIAVPC